jgi:hypothetical protein
MTKRLFILLLCVGSLAAHAQVFNCGGAGTAWASSGSCGVVVGGGQNFQLRGAAGAGVSGGFVNFVPTGSDHNGYGFFYNTAQDVRAFSATFTFVLNQWNLAFVVQNATVNPGYTGGAFTSGAGCEGGYYQGFGTRPNNVFSLSFSNSDTTSQSGTAYGAVQIYQQNQEPCAPNDGSSNWIATNRLSPSPVSLTASGNAQYANTTDTYSATVSYDGSNFNLCLYDVTAATGSCSSSTAGTGNFFQHTWSNVSIPSLLNSTTGYIGFNSGVGSGPAAPSTSNLYVKSFAYTVNTATATPSSTATSGGASTVANPTFSPAAGTYSGTQLVTIATSTGGTYICYAVGAAGAVILPQPDNYGLCGSGTLYTGPVAVSSTQTLYATAGYSSNGASGSGYLPSGYVQAAYTISANGIPTKHLGNRFATGNSFSY